MHTFRMNNCVVSSCGQIRSRGGNPHWKRAGHYGRQRHMHVLMHVQLQITISANHCRSTFLFTFPALLFRFTMHPGHCCEHGRELSTSIDRLCTQAVGTMYKLSPETRETLVHGTRMVQQECTGSEFVRRWKN